MKSTIGKSVEKSFRKLLFGVLFVVAAAGIFSLSQQQIHTQETTSYINSDSVQVSLTPVISLALSPQHIQKPTNTWESYTNGSVVQNSNLSFSYPSDWKVYLKRDSTKTTSTSLAFAFYPSHSGQSASLLIDVYPQSSSIDAFIWANFPQFRGSLTSTEYSKIGDKTLYQISPKTTIPATNSVYRQFGQHGVVLGSQHVYDIGFAVGSSSEITSQIISTIWPQLHIE